MINYKKIFFCLLASILIIGGNFLFVDKAWAAGKYGGTIKYDQNTGDVTGGKPSTSVFNTSAPQDVPSKTDNSNATDDGYSSACKGNTGDGIFSSLVCTGRLLFADLRELIYIVAGFGIIAVGVGGIFGNLNWKWLGAIIISLVIIATAGELITAMLGDAHGIENEYSANAVQASLQE